MDVIGVSSVRWRCTSDIAEGGRDESSDVVAFVSEGGCSSPCVNGGAGGGSPGVVDEFGQRNGARRLAFGCEGDGV